MIFKKTKQKQTFTVETIEEIFKRIKDDEKQRLYDEAIADRKTYRAVLSPRNKHVTLMVTDEDQNI